MDYFSKIINVFSSAKNETVEAESQESSGQSQYSHSPYERDTIPPGQHMSQMQPQGNSMYAVSINGQSLLETTASHIQPTKHKGLNSMIDQRLEGAAPHTQTVMNHYHNYKPTVSMNGLRLDDTVPQLWHMNTTNYQDSTNMNDQRLEGAAPHVQTLMNDMHHHPNFKPTGQRLDGIAPHALHTNPLPQVEGTIPHPQGLSIMNGQKSEHMLNDEVDILNNVPEGLLSEKDKEELRNLSLITSKEFFRCRLFSDSSKELKKKLCLSLEVRSA